MADSSFEGPGPDARYRAFLEQGKFCIQYCPDSDRYIFYPRAICPHSGSTNLEWREASGRGTVYSTTVVRRKPDRGGNYNVALIDLEEGPRMMSRVDGVAPDKVAIGMAVKAKIVTEDGAPLVVFEGA